MPSWAGKIKLNFKEAQLYFEAQMWKHQTNCLSLPSGRLCSSEQGQPCSNMWTSVGYWDHVVILVQSGLVVIHRGLISIEMANQVPFLEAAMAMSAMMIVLIFILLIYCFIPAYRTFKRRQELIENYWEIDPRWSDDKFMFSPKLPSDYMKDKKYSRLACSRSSRWGRLFGS